MKKLFYFIPFILLQSARIGKFSRNVEVTLNIIFLFGLVCAGYAIWHFLIRKD